MLHTEGIVFRTTRFRESSVILDIYTEAKGLQTFIANGVYSKTSQRLASLFQLMNLLDVVSYFSEHKEIHRIKEVNPSVLYQRIPFDIKRSAIGTFVLEVCRKSISGHHANAELFQFIKSCFIHLDQMEQMDAKFPLRFLINFSAYLGFQPLDNYSEEANSFDLMNGHFSKYAVQLPYSIVPDDSYLLVQLLRDDPIHLTIEQRRRLLNYLLHYYKLHLEHFKDMKSLEVFKGIF